MLPIANITGSAFSEGTPLTVNGLPLPPIWDFPDTALEQATSVGNLSTQPIRDLALMFTEATRASVRALPLAALAAPLPLVSTAASSPVASATASSSAVSSASPAAAAAVPSLVDVIPPDPQKLDAPMIDISDQLVFKATRTTGFRVLVDQLRLYPAKHVRSFSYYTMSTDYPGELDIRMVLIFSTAQEALKADLRGDPLLEPYKFPDETYKSKYVKVSNSEVVKYCSGCKRNQLTYLKKGTTSKKHGGCCKWAARRQNADPLLIKRRLERELKQEVIETSSEPSPRITAATATATAEVALRSLPAVPVGGDVPIIENVYRAVKGRPSKRRLERELKQREMETSSEPGPRITAAATAEVSLRSLPAAPAGQDVPIIEDASQAVKGRPSGVSVDQLRLIENVSQAVKGAPFRISVDQLRLCPVQHHNSFPSNSPKKADYPEADLKDKDLYMVLIFDSALEAETADKKFPLILKPYEFPSKMTYKSPFVRADTSEVFKYCGGCARNQLTYIEKSMRFKGDGGCCKWMNIRVSKDPQVLLKLLQGRTKTLPLPVPKPIIIPSVRSAPLTLPAAGPAAPPSALPSALPQTALAASSSAAPTGATTASSALPTAAIAGPSSVGEIKPHVAIIENLSQAIRGTPFRIAVDQLRLCSVKHHEFKIKAADYPEANDPKDKDHYMVVIFDSALEAKEADIAYPFLKPYEFPSEMTYQSPFDRVAVSEVFKYCKNCRRDQLTYITGKKSRTKKGCCKWMKSRKDADPYLLLRRQRRQRPILNTLTSVPECLIAASAQSGSLGPAPATAATTAPAGTVAPPRGGKKRSRDIWSIHQSVYQYSELERRGEVTIQMTLEAAAKAIDEVVSVTFAGQALPFNKPASGGISITLTKEFFSKEGNLGELFREQFESGASAEIVFHGNLTKCRLHIQHKDPVTSFKGWLDFELDAEVTPVHSATSLENGSRGHKSPRKASEAELKEAPAS